MSILSRSIALGLGLSAAALAFSPSAWAVPSFARQTGLACAACHTTYPELTSFGRLFKLNGYTLTGLQQVQASAGGGMPALKINEIPPFSAMFQTSYSNVGKARPQAGGGYVQNNTVQFPRQMSFFFAGEMSPHMGSFIQFTYEPSPDHFTIDNTDIRYANHTTFGGDDLIYGLDLNNNPTVEDVWQSTPAWGFPFIHSSIGYGFGYSPQIFNLGQTVAGLGGYAMWNNTLYADVSVYRSEIPGSPTRLPTVTPALVNGVAPYWRVALQHNFGPNYLEVGTYGIYLNATPTNNGSGTVIASTSATDSYLDTGVDAQYERQFGDNSLVVRGTYVHEKQTLNASYSLGGLVSNRSNSLDTLRLNGTYHFGDSKSLSVGYFNTWGTSDKLLYNSGTAGSGSISGSPDTTGYLLQAAYLPWQNIQVGVQYTGYTKFNGASSNYDGAGRSASDNNTVFLYGWFMW